MSREKKVTNQDIKLNKLLKITFIIFLISGIIALVVILNKGKLFGKNMVEVSNGKAVEVVHSIQLVADKVFLAGSGDTTNLSVTIDGLDATEGYELTSSDPNIISIEGNAITAVAEGTAIITAKSTEYDVTSDVTIDVVTPITKITISSEHKNITVGGETTLSYAFQPSTATANIVYTTADETIATVNESGIVTGVGTGTVVLTATDKVTGKSANCKITVK